MNAQSVTLQPEATMGAAVPRPLCYRLVVLVLASALALGTAAKVPAAEQNPLPSLRIAPLQCDRQLATCRLPERPGEAVRSRG